MIPLLNAAESEKSLRQQDRRLRAGGKGKNAVGAPANDGEGMCFACLCSTNMYEVSYSRFAFSSANFIGRLVDKTRTVELPLMIRPPYLVLTGSNLYLQRAKDQVQSAAAGAANAEPVGKSAQSSIQPYSPQLERLHFISPAYNRNRQVSQQAPHDSNSTYGS